MLPVDRFVHPADPKPWRAGAWIAWSLLVVAEVAIAILAALLISFGASTTCGATGLGSNVAAGQRDIWFAIALLAAPWLVAGFISPRRWPVFLLGWLCGCVPLLLMSATHTQPHDWVGGFCF